MAFDVNAFVINKVTKIVHTDYSGVLNWYTNQVQDFSVKVDGEETQKKDADGNVIATITKGKSCSVSFATPIFDLNIVAAQNATTKEVASESAPITATAFEEYTISEGQTTITIKNSVNTDTLSVSSLTTDGSLKKAYTVGSAAASGVVTYTDSSKTITFAEGDVETGDTILVVYEYEATEAVGVTASAKNFPNAGRLYVQVLGFDICQPDEQIYAYYRFANAKMKSSYQHDIKLDTTYSIEMDCAVDYCDKDKLFYNLVIPNESDAA